VEKNKSTVKTSVSPGAIIGFILLVSFFGIAFSVSCIKDLINEGLTIQGVVVFFFLGFLPVFTGVFVLINYFRGKDYDISELEHNTTIPLSIKILRFFFSLLIAGMFFFVFLFLQAIEKESLLPKIVVIILQDLVAVAMLAYIFLSIGKLKDFKDKKKKGVIRISHVILMIVLFLLFKFLIKR
jgi:hypothetical protein